MCRAIRLDKDDKRGTLNCEGDSEHWVILSLLETGFHTVLFFLPMQNVLSTSGKFARIELCTGEKC
jgi:hypothetical protein